MKRTVSILDRNAFVYKKPHNILNFRSLLDAINRNCIRVNCRLFRDVDPEPIQAPLKIRSRVSRKKSIKCVLQDPTKSHLLQQIADFFLQSIKPFTRVPRRNPGTPFLKNAILFCRNSLMQPQLHTGIKFLHVPGLSSRDYSLHNSNHQNQEAYRHNIHHTQSK